MTRKTSKAGLLVILGKVSPKLLSVLMKLLKTVKIGKVGLAATSMGAYSLLFSWQFALLILLLLFVHESGHIWAMKKAKMKTKGIYFIPFLGAAAVTEEMFPSRKAEVFVAIMGPIWGFALSLAVLIIWWLDMLANLIKRNSPQLYRPQMNRAEIIGSAASYLIVAGLLFGIMQLTSGVPGAELKQQQTFDIILPNLIHKSKKRNLTRRIARQKIF